MEPEDVRAARLELQLSSWDMATLLGYTGNLRRDMMFQLESGRKPVREPQRRLIEAYLAGYRPIGWPDASEYDEFTEEWALRRAL